jgi:ribonuclease BN (tRNA processing enzyme)
VPDAVRVTVLGKSPSWQDADGACSGYLVEDEGVRVLLDCGNGVFAKLRRYADYIDVDAVVISHLHADHFLDLVPFAYALTHSPRQQHAERARPVLHAPPGARATFRRVVGAWGSEELIEAAFTLREYDPAEVLHAGPLTLRFQPVPHFVPAHAVEVTSAQGGRFTYGADSGPTDALVGFARGTDLLVIEATLPRPEPEGPRGHLTPVEAGEHGRRAEARRLVITHLTDELDAARAEEDAERGFGGPVEVAREGAVYEL